MRKTTDVINNIIDSCRQKNVPYLDINTGMSHVLKSENIRYESHDASFPINELYFIGLVRKKILEKRPNKKKLKASVKVKRIQYFKYSNYIRTNSTIRNCVEVDMDAAYWESAYKLGVLPDDIYRRALYGMDWITALNKNIITQKEYELCAGLTPIRAFRKKIISESSYTKVKPITKIIRLASIGSLSKVTRVTYYTGTRLHMLFKHRDPLHYIWDAVCYRIYSIVLEAIREIGEENFIFFWVDAIVVKPGVEQKLIDFLKQKGYNSKKEYINRIEITDKKMFVFQKKKSKIGTKEVREFNLSVNDAQKTKKPYRRKY